MELEKAIEEVDKIRTDFFDSKYKDFHTETELAEKYEALCTILQYIKYDSISKKQIEDKIKELNEGIRKDMENYDKIEDESWKRAIHHTMRQKIEIKNCLQKLLEDN